MGVVLNGELPGNGFMYYVVHPAAEKNVSFWYDISIIMYSVCFIYLLGLTFSFFLQLLDLLARAVCWSENYQNPWEKIGI